MIARDKPLAHGNEIVVKYYPIARNWSRKIKPHLADPAVQKVLVRDFNRFTFGRWGREFKQGMTPHEFESWTGGAIIADACRSSGIT